MRILGLSFDPTGAGVRPLSGSIPSIIGKLGALEQLSLGGNKLEGTIPESVSGLTRLSQLMLSYNRLEGTVPPSFASLANLQVMFLSCNRLIGPLPPFDFAKAKICAANCDEHGWGPSCASMNVTDNSFSCPLHDSAAELCHARCQ